MMTIIFLLLILSSIPIGMAYSAYLRFKTKQPISLITAFNVLYFIIHTGWTHPYNGSHQITMVQTFMFYNIYVDRLANNYHDAKNKYINNNKESMQMAKNEYIKTLKKQQALFGHKN